MTIDRDAVERLAPERITAWPGSYPHFDNDDWMNGSCRSEDEAGADSNIGTWYVRAAIASQDKEAQG